MFTTIMNGVINEVTRQPASADIPLNANRGTAPRRPAARPRRKTRQAAGTPQPHGHLAGKYRVLADSFKCAAGFY